MLNCFGERVSTWMVFTGKLDLEGAVKALSTPHRGGTSGQRERLPEGRAEVQQRQLPRGHVDRHSLQTPTWTHSHTYCAQESEFCAGWGSSEPSMPAEAAV